MSFFVNHRTSEADLTFELAHLLRLEKIAFYLEYQVSPENRVRGIRSKFDMIVTLDYQLICIVETKKQRHVLPQFEEAVFWTKKKQLDRYAAYGVPLFVLRTNEDVKPALNSIKRLLHLHNESLVPEGISKQKSEPCIRPCPKTS